MNEFLFDPSEEIDYQTVSFPEPRPFQDKAHESLRQGARDGHRCQVLMAATGAGKCLTFDTPILMADGTIKMVQDVVVGDQLIGPDGNVRNVLSISQGRDRLYRIFPKKGMSYAVNASHILSLRKTPGCSGLTLSDGTVVPKDADIVNVNVEVFAASSKTVRHCLKGWRSGAIEFPGATEKEVWNPYFIGCWLGDGSQHRPTITKPDCEMVREWKRTAESFGYEVTVSQGSTGCPSWHIVSRQRDGKGVPYNILTMYLDALGLIQKKHIPHDYKTASISDRLKLLAGLIDSDGHLSHSGFDWISKDYDLANDFVFVCRSVGLSAYIRLCKKGIVSSGFTGYYWRVSVSGDTHIIPCLDKRAAPRKQKKRSLVHGIRVQPVGEGDYYGFEIDGDHLFLLGDFTVTHNTYLGMRIMYEALKKGKRALFVCDRTTLIEQTSNVADTYGLSAHGIIQASHWRTNSDYRMQIASVQTLARRQWPDVDVIIVDEAHTLYKSWTDHIKTCRANVIGLSATPFTKGLGLLFTNLVNAATMHELTKSCVLVPMKVLTCKRIDMKGAEIKGGEWTEAAAASRGIEIVGDVVAEWLTYAKDRKTIVFGATIYHCEEMARQFNQAGVSAAVFCSDTTMEERAEILKEYKKPDSTLRVLISVEALAKGFNVEDVSCVCDCRPLRKSLSTAIQMWGRGLRCSPEKTDCLLLDFSGNINRFKEDFEDIYFNGLDALDMGEKLDKTIREDKSDDEKTPVKCPECGHQPFFKKCMSCGHERKPLSLVQHAPGKMEEIIIGKAVAASNPYDLWKMCCTYARQKGTPDKQKWRAYYLYKDIIGKPPAEHWKFDQTPNVEISQAVHNKIMQKNIAYAKSRQKSGWYR